MQPTKLSGRDLEQFADLLERIVIYLDIVNDFKRSFRKEARAH
jgi:hypothetical protein